MSDSDDRYWAFALREVESGDRMPGLWARCFATCGGDENAAKAAYIRERVNQLQRGEVTNPGSGDGNLDVGATITAPSPAAKESLSEPTVSPTAGSGAMKPFLIVAAAAVIVCLVGVALVAGPSAPGVTTGTAAIGAEIEPGAARAPAPAPQVSAAGASAPLGPGFAGLIADAAFQVASRDMLEQIANEPWRQCARDMVTRMDQSRTYRVEGGGKCDTPDGPPTIKELASTPTPLGVKYQLLWSRPRKDCETLRSRWICEVSRAGDVIELDRFK
jgi:hypothetical protein